MSNLFIYSHKGGLIIRSMVKPPLWECINKWEFINLLVVWYQKIPISESLPIVNLTPVILKTFCSIHSRWEWTENLILDGSEDFTRTWVMSFQMGIGSLDETVFFRWDFVPLCKRWVIIEILLLWEKQFSG